MSRQIKFRGKNLKNEWKGHEIIPIGAWIYGYYYKSQHEHRIIQEWNLQSQLVYDVCEETIGQFTGCLDDDGKEIFEGDIISFCEDYSEYVYKFCGVVVCENGEFLITSSSGRWLLGVSWLHSECLHGGKTTNIKVVGNKYDDPDLLTRLETEILNEESIQCGQ